jgi:hypothetical protein
VVRIVVGASERTDFVSSERRTATAEAACCEMINPQNVACCWMSKRNGAGVTVFPIPLVQLNGKIPGASGSHRNAIHRSDA